MGAQGREAQRHLARVSDAQKAAALRAAARSIRGSEAEILAANALDIAAGEASGLGAAMLDRLRLDAKRLAGIADAVEQIAALPDPVGEVIDSATRPNGLKLSRVRVPIGLIGIIYESRPNVTVDAAALCLRSGNATLLRGGSEAVNSNRALHAAFVAGIEGEGLPATAVQLIPTQDRAAVGAMLAAAGVIDMIVPRGGKSLVERVQADARVPVLAHLDGICHTYIHSSADPDMAQAIALNAKMRRTGICGAMETLLIDARFGAASSVAAALIDAGCELARRCARLRLLDPRVDQASAEDWDTEYLDAVLSVAVVDGLDEALAHIARHSSGHTEAIVTQDEAIAERFLAEVDSAIVMVNASSQFADGGEFGLGAEIGIATGPPARARAGRARRADDLQMAGARHRPVAPLTPVPELSPPPRGPARRQLQSGARRPPAHFAVRTTGCARSRRGVVAGLARQSAQGRPDHGAAACPACLGQGAGPARADPGYRNRARTGHALHNRHAARARAALAQAGLCLADGHRQSCPISPLEALARDCPCDADCGNRQTGLWWRSLREPRDGMARAIPDPCGQPEEPGKVERSSPGALEIRP